MLLLKAGQHIDAFEVTQQEAPAAEPKPSSAKASKGKKVEVKKIVAKK